MPITHFPQFCGWLFGRPLAKEVDLDAACSEFFVPASFGANLSTGYAFLQSVQPWGFGGGISGLRAIELRSGLKIHVPSPGTLSLPVAPEIPAQPYLSLEPGPPVSLIGVDIGAGVTLRPDHLPSRGPRLDLTSSRRGAITAVLQAGRVAIQEALYPLPHRSPNRHRVCCNSTRLGMAC